MPLTANAEEAAPMAPESISVCKSGIYCIRNTVSGRVYVGSAMDIKGRWTAHRHRLKTGHHSAILLASWRKHGPEGFSWEILELVPDVSKLLEREQYWIDTLCSADRRFGMNMRKDAASNAGIEWSDEIKKNMSAVKKGKKKTPEHQAKITAALKGRKHSPETKAKISAANLGKKRTTEMRLRISRSSRGRKRTPESIAKTAAGLKGQKRTPEQCKRIAAARRGKRLSTEHKAAISSANKCRVFSPEHRAALTAAHERRRQRARADKAQLEFNL